MKTIRFPRRAVLLGGLAAFLSGCAGKFRSYDGPEVTRLRLYKGQRLLVLDGSDRVLQTYPIGLGFAPQGHKQFEGDGRTPEGTYIVDKRNPESTYHLSVGISYPNEVDIAFAEAQGLSPVRNPGSSGHRFRKYPATQSNFIRPVIPGYSATPVK